jgi:sigma-B regulation protein RsbU (phosphoserine phosphatase)
MQGIRSIVCAPLTISDNVVGLLYVDFQITQRQISEEDVRLVAQIARIAGIKLETTRLREEAIQKRIMDEELKTASTIQRRLLPPAPTGIPGYTFQGFNQPCRTVSGDYYDFVVRPGGRIYFAVADVSGKGVTAGLMMAGLQAAFRIFSKNDPDPAALVSQLNTALKENLPQSKFVTLFVGRLETATGLIEYTNAGHSPPLLVRRTHVDELGETDLLLGVVTRAEYITRRIQLEPGDSLVLYTDGVTEAENADGAELGSERLAASLAPFHGRDASAIGRAITDSVHKHVGELELGDDLTLLVVSRNSA